MHIETTFLFLCLTVISLCLQGVQCQKLALQKPTTLDNCTQSRESRALKYRGLVILNKNTRCRWNKGNEPNNSAVWLNWWHKVCLHSTTNLNLDWKWLMCRNITVVSCRTLDVSTSFCVDQRGNNKTHIFFTLVITPRHSNSHTYYKFTFEYAAQCNSHEAVVFQLPKIVGPPSVTFLFNNEPGKVFYDEFPCTHVVHREQMNRLRFCVHNMQNPSLTLTLPDLFTAKVKSDCIEAGGYITIDQLPRTLQVVASDDCGESVSYKCTLKFNPGISITANNENVWITERTKTCQMFMYTGRVNTISVCVHYFENYFLKIRLENSSVLLPPKSHSCITMEFLDKLAYDGHVGFFLTDETSLYILATYYCRLVACSQIGTY